MSETVSPGELVYDEAVYPRMKLSSTKVHEYTRMRKAGHEPPPVIACRATKRIVDGVHRWTVACELGIPSIAVEWRDYGSDAELFRDAVVLNTSHGLDLSPVDKVRVIDMGQRFGLKEFDLAGMLRTDARAIQKLMPRYATISTEDRGKVTLERVPLKASVRHLAGESITPEQRDAISGNAPGASYLLLVRQLISGIQNDLLPPPERHPVLWAELAALGELIAQLPQPEPASQA